MKMTFFSSKLASQAKYTNYVAGMVPKCSCLKPTIERASKEGRKDGLVFDFGKGSDGNESQKTANCAILSTTRDELDLFVFKSCLASENLHEVARMVSTLFWNQGRSPRSKPASDHPESYSTS